MQVRIMSDKYDKQSTARLPLVESVIIIAIFSIVSVVIMQMYISANKLQTRAVNISKAMILAENRAEEIKSGNLNTEPRYYDSEWNETQDESRFKLSCIVTEEGKGPYGAYTKLKIVITDKNGEELISLNTGRYSQ